MNLLTPGDGGAITDSLINRKLDKKSGQNEDEGGSADPLKKLQIPVEVRVKKLSVFI